MKEIIWKQATKNSYITDVGDIRLILKESKTEWNLAMGIRVYTTDGANSMVRPPVSVARFNKPCDEEQVKAYANSYINKFISSIISALADENEEGNMMK